MSRKYFPIHVFVAIFGLAATAFSNAITATWSSGNGNWTTPSQWSCTPAPTSCLPNNDVTDTYTANLSSSGHTLVLDSTSSPSTITVNSASVSSGTLQLGPNSTLNVNGPFTVGGSGGATLNILDGASLYSSGGNIATVAGTTGSVTITQSSAMGAGQWFTNGANLNLGAGGSLSITNGGLLATAGGNLINNGGSITVGGGLSSFLIPFAVHQTSGSLDVKANGFFQAIGDVTQDGGTANLNSGSQFTMFNYYLNGGSAVVDGSVYGTSLTVTDGGVLSGKGSIYATVINDGDMAPGHLTLYQPLFLDFIGNYTELISGPNDFGLLTDQNSVILGGNLTIQLLGGYVPSLGDTFQFIDAPNYLDAFHVKHNYCHQ
jgi:T5SS/PEP-CTERM-associated repeat protein